MTTGKNPFYLKGYHGPAHFCNREDEVALLTTNALNDVNTTLLSQRRMGKTGLIYHFFNLIEQSGNTKGIYVDIYATQNLADFTNQLATSILSVYPQHNGIGKKFLDLIKGFKPVISYDVLTGQPEVSFSFSTPQQQSHSLQGLFGFLEMQKQKIVVAFDEFQQIAAYPEKNIEALLRTLIQPLKKTSFIFSGSHKHLLAEIFNSAKRPFFSSTQSLYLGAINKEKYGEFIEKLFAGGKKNIGRDSVEYILEWTKIHTYYTQAVCNKLYANTGSKITINDVYKTLTGILKEEENTFYQYRNLLTGPQWRLLTAIAKEQKVYQPTGAAFVGNYKLGNPASVRRSLESLVSKEMVLQNNDDAGTSYYQVYDCFLSRWLERL